MDSFNLDGRIDLRESQKRYQKGNNTRGRVEEIDDENKNTLNVSSSQPPNTQEFVLFDGDATFTKVKQSSGRVAMLHFHQSGRRDFFWMQEATDANDAENITKVSMTMFGEMCCELREQYQTKREERTR
jgi:hypothetical protein